MSTSPGGEKARPWYRDKTVIAAVIGAVATVTAAVVGTAAGGAGAEPDDPRPQPTVTVTTTETVEAEPDRDASEAPDGDEEVASPSAAPEASIQLSTDQGVVGGTFTVTGEGFQVGERVEIEWAFSNGQVTITPLRDVDVGGQGGFETEVTVPDSHSANVVIDPGAYAVVATGTDSERTDKHLFTLLEE